MLAVHLFLPRVSSCIPVQPWGQLKPAVTSSQARLLHYTILHFASYQWFQHFVVNPRRSAQLAPTAVRCHNSPVQVYQHDHLDHCTVHGGTHGLKVILLGTCRHALLLSAICSALQARVGVCLVVAGTGGPTSSSVGMTGCSQGNSPPTGSDSVPGWHNRHLTSRQLDLAQALKACARSMQAFNTPARHLGIPKDNSKNA